MLARFLPILILCTLLTLNSALLAGTGTPYIVTDHPYYPGEKASANLEELRATQAKLYEHVTGKPPQNEQEMALASWLWRNTHYWHGEPGGENIWGQGYGKGPDGAQREYWTGLNAFGFALCGTTHAQWTAEMQHLLGHNRGRTVGTAGHNSFEVFLTGGPYQNGKWVLLDHDLSTVIFDKEGKSLLSIAEVAKDWKQYAVRDYAGNKASGWLPCGLHQDDGGSYASYSAAEYFPGYLGPPPIVYLRRGETLRKYYEPGLEDGKTFVYWGRNYNTGGIPGPERSHTWVNQPEKMFRSKNGAGYKPGQARYANAVYTYRPDFSNDDYREGVIDESNEHVTLEFYTPYIIGASPAGNGPWDIYQSGCKQGLVISGGGAVPVSISVDQGQSWQDIGKLNNQLDATDVVKGYRQYWLKFYAGAKQLAMSKPTITTVCQMNVALLPRLVDGKNTLKLGGDGIGIVSAGPTVAQAKAHLVAGDFNTPTATLELKTPRGENAIAIYAAAQWRSSNPPDPSVEYFIDYSLDQGTTWQPLVKDWKITRRGDEPADFWSQSFCYGDLQLNQPTNKPVQVRFRNTHKKALARAEVHLRYTRSAADAFVATLCWSNAQGEQQAQVQGASSDKPITHVVEAGDNARMKWVEVAPLAK